MYDAIIIGAGMSGLAAGIRLAHYDKRVCILERHSAIGGLNSFYRQRGRNFDVGLHALTNFAPKGARRGPLCRLLRQLRLKWDELALAPQVGSEIAFPGVRLRFSNDAAVLEAEIERYFPGQIDNFRRLLPVILDYDRLGAADSGRSARAVLGSIISEPLLVEMLLCPLFFYGGCQEHDMDFHQFSIMFRAIYLEGLARPFAGARLILNKLARRFKQLGGELRLRCGVERIAVENGRVKKLVLEDGSELQARRVLSSAGLPETLRLCDDRDGNLDEPPGKITFVESISVLDKLPRSIGIDRTIVFFNDSARFSYRKPDELIDVHSGVICSPNNFVYDEPPAEGAVRTTSLANYQRWAALNDDAYRLAKLRCYDRAVASAVRFVPDYRGSVIDTDLFTPITIRRFTGRAHGAVYGVVRKRHDGRTHLENLYICGADQGFVGIVGTLLSGITVVNRHFLSKT